MNTTNRRKNQSWINEDTKVVAFEESIRIPTRTLTNVPNIAIRREIDLTEIPNQGGCYWIWTNEPIHHTLHRNDNPDPFNSGEIIYNGHTKDNIRWRVRNHLFSSPGEGWSGISVDILLDYAVSHRKKAMSIQPRAKTAYVNRERVTNKDALLQLNLTEAERNYIQNTDSNVFYFRNGINIAEEKHLDYEFRVYFIVGLSSATYMDFIENEWRRKYGLPKLCSYSSGR